MSFEELDEKIAQMVSILEDTFSQEVMVDELLNQGLDVEKAYSLESAKQMRPSEALFEYRF